MDRRRSFHPEMEGSCCCVVALLERLLPDLGRGFGFGFGVAGGGSFHSSAIAHGGVGRVDLAAVLGRRLQAFSALKRRINN